jgi:hypothetical protein
MLSHKSEDIQRDMGNSLTATGLIAVLLLSIIAGEMNLTVEAAPGNLFGESSWFFVGLWRVFSYGSFAFSTTSLGFIVNLYSQLVRVPAECIPAFLQRIGIVPFLLIWILPNVSLGLYVGAVVVRFAVQSSMWMGIYVIAITPLGGSFMLFLLKTDSVHGMIVNVEGECAKWKRENPMG